MTATLARPGRRPGALVAVALDPRPCVVNPPQWWDLGDDGNATAMWLCRTRCPFNNDENACEITPGTIRRGQPYGDSPKPVKVCQDCRHPRVRQGTRGPAYCKCPHSGRTREQIVQAWLAAGGDTRTVKDIAADIGMDYESLKDALRRARKSGDRRVPLNPSGRQAAAA